MKVLFAVDGSSGSFEALGQVGVLLSPEKDEVALYCSPPAPPRFAVTTSPEVLARARQGLVDAVFDESRKRLPQPLQAEAQTITGTHDARHGIVDAARDWGAQLIVVGARGLGTLERLLLGSVSRAVVHAARIPVWVSRAEQPRPDHPGARVLLACEDAKQGECPAEFLHGFTWPEKSSCQVVSVVQSLFAGRVPEWLEQQARSPDVEEMVQAWAREHDEEIRLAQERMDAYLPQLPAGLADRRATVAEGEPAEVILSKIKEQAADLVVVGVHHKNWLATTLLGSTSEAVLNHAHCSVLVVPHGEAG